MRHLKAILISMMVTVCAVSYAQEMKVTPPQPEVPEIFTIQGQYVRVAYNNEGYATLGYRTAQGSVGGEWILLNVGVSLMKDVQDYTLKREAFTLKIPDGTIVPLPTQSDFNKADNCRNLVLRDNKINDSINYFPNWVNNACALRFFAQRGKLSFDEAEVASNRACVGRVFFKVPGGIVPGQYWLNIQFATSMVQVPFRIMTKEEQEIFSKKWQDMKKELDQMMKQ